MSSNNTPSSKSTTTATRRGSLLQAAVGRPLRRVSRALVSGSKKQQNTNRRALYGSTLDSPQPQSVSSTPPRGGASGRRSSSVTASSNRARNTTTEALSVASSSTAVYQNYSDDDSQIVVTLERILRQVLLLLGAYLLGNSQPHRAMVPHITEYVGVAWVTCILILLLSVITKRRSPDEKQHVGDEEERMGLLTNEDEDLLDEEEHEEPRGLFIDDEHQALGIPTLEPSFSPTKEQPCRLPHPSLEPLFLLNSKSSERIMPNTGQSYRLDNELFEGVMMALVRTPDCEETHSAASYFADKQRRWEFQFQVRLKKVPEGRIYFAAELQEPIKMGMVQRAFVGAAMAFMKKMNPTFSFSLTKTNLDDGGDYEVPHTAFTVDGSMDRIVATKPGDPLPVLGEAIEEDPESIKRRKKGGTIDWNTQDTFTFAMWTAYVDLLDWRCLNLPGIRPFPLASVIGDQYISLTLYGIPEGMNSHGKQGRAEYLNLEMSNFNYSSLGPCARQWIDYNSVELEGVGEEGLSVPGAMESLDEEDEEEAADVDALGEGIYLRSGDSIILQEVAAEDKELGFVCNGGGFAVLQDHATATVIIEKADTLSADRSFASESTRARARLIKSGDKVLIKLIAKGEEAEVKYLSIHRGWWLKWVSTLPTKNGFFRIYTHESEFDPGRGRVISSETQSSFLTLGGAFWLRHQRWSRYQVGVNAQESASYGGRMLGLFKSDSSGIGGEARQSDDESESDEEDEEGFGGKRDRQWVRPIQLKARLAGPSASDLEAPLESFESSDPVLRSLLAGNFEIDVPVWIEMMNRTARKRQLLYVVRVRGEIAASGESSTEQKSDDDSEDDVVYSFSRLRTGDELASLIRLAQTHRKDPVLALGQPGKPKRGLSHEYVSDDEMVRDVSGTVDRSGLVRAQSTPGFIDLGIDSGGEAISSWAEESIAPSSPSGLNHSQHGKRRGRLMGQIAKSVKTGTALTGKQVVKQSKKVGKGTVSAGKKIIMPISKTNVRSNRPPSKEPSRVKIGQSKSRRLPGRDHYIVVNREMRRMEEEAARRFFLDPPKFLAGQLSASDQSCRTASHMLSQIRNDAASSDASRRFAAELSSHISPLKDFDGSFLQGGSIQVGVVPDTSNERLLHECLVARCLWESHWREEWCGIYEKAMLLYAPLSKKPALQLAFADVESIRRLEFDEFSPLPGLAILAIETAWQCHYVAFCGNEQREAFVEKLNSAIAWYTARSERLDDEQSVREQALFKARLWQGFQSSVESSLSGGQGKWAKVSSTSTKMPSGSKMIHRTILNKRKMVFDVATLSNVDGLDASTGDLCLFVEGLLSTSLSFSEDSLQDDPQKFVDFLDNTSRLRHVALGDIDLSSTEALCLFVNLYHCLLQHALLLTVKGPLNRRSCGHFMRSTSYEIGGDVFSLAELHCCIIRGKMSRALSPRPPYIEAPRKSSSYRYYAVDRTDPRVNFVLNTGDASCHHSVPILIPDLLDHQLDVSTRLFVRAQMTVDANRRVIVLPKLCEVYRNDFGTSDRAMVSFCSRYLTSPDRAAVQTLLTSSDEREDLTIKFQHTATQYRVALRLSGSTEFYSKKDDGVEDE